MASRRVEIIGHRGASIAAPENTLAAIRLAWDWRADAVEIDVHLTRDRQVVAIHDDSLLRTSQADVAVRDLTLAELQSYDVGAWKFPEFAGERVPTLAEVIATIPLGKRLYVELKCGAEVLEPLAEVLASVRERPESVVLIGFDPELMSAAKQRFPEHLVFQVVEQTQQPDGQWSPSAAEIISHCVKHGLDGADLSNTLAVDHAAVEQFKAAGLGVCIWTVNTLADARRLIDAGVDSLTTDDPRLLLSIATQDCSE